MGEKKTFKNVTVGMDSPGYNGGVGYWVKGERYPGSEWDLEVTLTRKVKPIPVGTLVVNPHSLALYLKLETEWVYVDRDTRKVEDLAERASNQNDNWYRINTEPLLESNWTEVDKG